MVGVPECPEMAGGVRAFLPRIVGPHAIPQSRFRDANVATPCGDEPTMRRKHVLIPAAIDLLEIRLVPSHAAASVVPSAASIQDQVNREFDAFQVDYEQARSTYYSSIQNLPNPGPATIYAFTSYTTQRVSLLAQEVLGTIGQARPGTARTRSLEHLVRVRIIGPRDQMPYGSLAQALLASPPQPGTTAPTSSLYSLSEDAAIESARVAILNGVERR